MTLDEAYLKLGHVPRDVWKSGGVTAGVRHTGSSFHMIVELALDLRAAQQRPGRQAHFVVVVSSFSEQQRLREILQGVYRTLHQEDISRRAVSFISPAGAPWESLRGVNIYSWSVFCDFAVKEKSCEPNLWPLDSVRRLCSQDQNTWSAYDRDGRLLSVLTQTGKKELLDAATCPVQCDMDGVLSVVYAPWTDPRIPIRVSTVTP